MEATIKSDILKRLQCIEGHTRGVCRMIEADQDCTAVIRQIHALQGALRKVKMLLIEDYLTVQLLLALDASGSDAREDIIGQFVKLLSEEGLK